jgi:hypothetical protein
VKEDRYVLVHMIHLQQLLVFFFVKYLNLLPLHSSCIKYMRLLLPLQDGEITNNLNAPLEFHYHEDILSRM